MKSQAKLHERVLGFMLVRFGRMALVADALGHAAEQAIMRQAARRLRALAGQDVAGRFGDDAFALSVLRRDAEELGHQAERLLTALGAPYVVGGQELYLDPRIGIAVYPDDALAYDALAKHAEAALRQIADGSAQRHAFYRPDLNLDAGERIRMEIALRQAIERDELVLHYQPQVDLASGAIVGAEALLRWQHPVRGMISPAHFIPLAEQSSLIILVGEWALRHACAQLRDWRRAGLPIVPVSINLSAHQFSARIVTALRRTLDAYGVEAGMIELELTETASMADAAQSRELLQQLKALGVALAIDDFGTGYSNLNYLKRFPIDKLKLDQSFVRDIQNDEGDQAISRAVVALGHGLRLVVVAEGVETGAQRDLLVRLGCDVGQGYLFSPPVPAPAFARMLADGLAAASQLA
jgi:diguanylate cyclase (GGDEF)-like protein